jgi:hypothetical protein
MSLFPILFVDPHRGQPECRFDRVFAGQGDVVAARVHAHHHAGAHIAASGFDFLDADDIGIGGQLQVVLNTHGGQDIAHILGQLAAQTLDLVGELVRSFALHQRQQAITQFEADRIHRQRFGYRFFGDGGLGLFLLDFDQLDRCFFLTSADEPAGPRGQRAQCEERQGWNGGQQAECEHRGGTHIQRFWVAAELLEDDCLR